MIYEDDAALIRLSHRLLNGFVIVGGLPDSLVSKARSLIEDVGATPGMEYREFRKLAEKFINDSDRRR